MAARLFSWLYLDPRDRGRVSRFAFRVLAVVVPGLTVVVPSVALGAAVAYLAR